MSEVTLYIVEFVESVRLDVRGTRNVMPRTVGWDQCVRLLRNSAARA